MVAENSDKLPLGWKEYVKVKNGRKTKYYSKAATGQKFYSKVAVLRYVNMEVNGVDTPRPQSEKDCNQTPQTSVNQGNKADSDGPDTNGSSEWLPDGWITEVKSRPGGRKTFKIYIDPATGKKFYSRPEVSRYLKAQSQKEVPAENNQDGADTNQSAMELPPGWITEEQSRSSGSTYKNAAAKKLASEGVYEHQGSVKKRSTFGTDDIECGSVEGLPVGWTKEIKIRRLANGKKKKDPYYTDPLSGYIFRSKRDALRYLETGDISKCSMKPTQGPVPNAISHEHVSSSDLSAHHISTKETRSISNREANKVSNYSAEPVKSDRLQNTAVDGLPIGWIRETQARRGGRGKDSFYIDPISGYMFRSKLDALRYIETGDISKCSIKPKTRDVNDIGSAKQANDDDSCSQRVLKEGQSSVANEVQLQNPADDGLPIGWTKEIQIRRDGIGKDYIYTDPISGYMFRSKKDALRYIETGDISKCAIKPKKRDVNDTGSTKEQNDASQQQISWKDQRSVSKSVENQRSLSKRVENQRSVSNRVENQIGNYSGDPIQISAADGLPVGWTREIQIRKDGIGKDSFYTDPISGYMFRSKMDALRYIETGDISKCAIKPKKRDVNDTGSTKEQNDASQQQISRKDQPSASERVENQIGNYSGDPIQISAADGLPVGWTREIQIRKDGIGKDSFYTDPISGYMFRSKMDALRYIETGDISKCAIKPKKRDANDPTSTKQGSNGVSGDHTQRKDWSTRIYERDQNKSSNHSVEIVKSDQRNSSSVYGLPIGWTRETQTRRDGIGKDSFYVDPVSGYMFRSKKDALRYIETGDISKCAMKPKKRDATAAASAEEHAATNGVSGHNIPREDKSTSIYQREQNKSNNHSGEIVKSDQHISSAVDDLPIGWTREIQIRRDGVGKDSFYTDPVSGYMFRSKKDALRYIETGDISKCAIKPKKRDPNAAGSSEHVGDPITPVTTRNSLGTFNTPDAGEENYASISKGVRSLSSKRKRSSSLTGDSGSPTKSLTKRTEQSTPGRTSKRLAGCQPEMPNLQVSERDLRAAMKISCEDEASILPMITMNALTDEVSQPLYSLPASVDANPSNKQELPKRIMKQQVRSNAPTSKGITPNTPGRTSEQQTGSGSEFLSSSQLSEGSLCAEMRKSSEDEAHVFPWIDINDVPHVVPQPMHSGFLTNNTVGVSAEDEPHPLNTESAPEVSDIVSMVVDSISNMDAGQKNAARSSQQICEKQDLQNLKPQDVQGGYQFGDPLPNSFMNFTFNNSAGVTPDESNLGFQGFSQQQNSNPFFQGNEYSGWSGSRNLGFSQVGNLPHSNSGRQPPHMQQFPSPFAAPGFGYPSSFGSGTSQQPTSDKINNIVYKRNQ